MELGQDLWERCRPFYEQLQLARDGDPLEIQAVTDLQLSASIPSYQAFWRIQIAPGTLRPISIALRPNCSKLFSVFAYNSYGLFAKLAEATGVRNDVPTWTLSWLRDALQSAMTLRRCVEMTLRREIRSTSNSADQPFLENMSNDDCEAWDKSFAALQEYLTYLESVPRLRSVPDSDQIPELTVLRFQATVVHTNGAWKRLEDQHRYSTEEWTRMHEAIRFACQHAFELANSLFASASGAMAHCPLSARHQHNWGWRHNVPPIPEC